MNDSVRCPDLPEQIAGNRVLLRPPRAGDGVALWDAIDESRASLRVWLPWTDQHAAPADSEAYVCRARERWERREELTYAVWDRETGALLGGSGLHPSDWTVPAFEIGYWLRVPAQGKGYMTETVALLCRLAFESVGANRVFIRVDEGNERSAAIPRRLGFRLEGTIRNDGRRTDGVLRNMLMFSMLPDEYAAVSPRWQMT